MTDRNARGGQGDDREPMLPADEEAAWAQIVAAYGDEPVDEPEPAGGPVPGDDATDRERPAGGDGAGPPSGGSGSERNPGDGTGSRAGASGQDGPDTARTRDSANAADAPGTADAAGAGNTADATDVPDGTDAGAGDQPVRSFTVYSAGTGPRDWRLPESSGEEDDEGHFVPPEPPPLPETDTVTKFAWLAAVGGPLLLFGAVLFQFDMTWWVVTLGVGGFLGGFATLVARMRDGRDDDDFDDPGRGAVV